jgi:hypothetical protein
MAKIIDKKFEQVKKNYRKAYPDVDLFFTTDGNCFLKKAMADAHARSEKLEVVECLVEEKEAPKATAPNSEDGKGDAMTEEKAKELLAELALDDKADYHLLGDIVEALEVEVDGKSKEDRIAALKPIQDELKAE